jgi:hypothetical protein
MDNEVKSLYTFMLGNDSKPWVKITYQEITPEWWVSIRSDYCFYVRIMNDRETWYKDFYIVKAGD